MPSQGAQSAQRFQASQRQPSQRAIQGQHPTAIAHLLVWLDQSLPGQLSSPAWLLQAKLDKAAGSACCSWSHCR